MLLDMLYCFFYSLHICIFYHRFGNTPSEYANSLGDDDAKTTKEEGTVPSSPTEIVENKEIDTVMGMDEGDQSENKENAQVATRKRAMKEREKVFELARKL